MAASAKYLRQRRRDLAAAGRCTACAEPLPEGHRGKECPPCQAATRKRAKARSKRIRNAWRALGRCYFCGGEKVPGYTLCGYHLEMRSEAKERRRGIKCMDCKNPVEPGFARCPIHLEANKQRMKDRRSRKCSPSVLPSSRPSCRDTSSAPTASSPSRASSAPAKRPSSSSK